MADNGAQISKHPFGTKRDQVLTRLAADAGIDLQLGQQVRAQACGPGGFIVLLTINFQVSRDFAVSALPRQTLGADALAAGKIQGP